jgi:hypothetical protein|tara:strand:+ start:23 stop:568 length:546 start_codon:yes stop_codon:yes gene_type:complete
MPNEKILEKNFIAMEELSCPSDYKLLKNTYILHLTGGYHFFNHRCLPNKNIKKIYREPIWPYVERINIPKYRNGSYKKFPIATVTKTDQYPKLNLHIEGEKIERENQKQTPIKTFYMHRLVSLAVHPNPENLPVVNHINGITVDYRPQNLEWSTVANNNRGQRPRGSYDTLYDIMELKGFV